MQHDATRPAASFLSPQSISDSESSLQIPGEKSKEVLAYLIGHTNQRIPSINQRSNNALNHTLDKYLRYTAGGNLGKGFGNQHSPALIIPGIAPISPAPTALTIFVISNVAIVWDNSLLILRYISMLPSVHTQPLTLSISPWWSLTTAMKRTRFPTSSGGSARMFAIPGYSLRSGSTCDTPILSI